MTLFKINKYFNYKTKRQQFLPLPTYPKSADWDDKKREFEGKFGPNEFGLSLGASDSYCWSPCGLSDVYMVTYIQQKYESLDNTNVYNIDELNQRGAYNNGAWIAWLDQADIQSALHTPKIEFLRCNKVLQTATSIQVEPPAYRIFPDMLSKVHQGQRVR